MEKLNSEPAGPSIRGECGYRDGLSEVSVFRTRDGLVGFYQLRGLADADGRGVNIRYKLVLGGSPNAPFVVSPDTTQSAPIPVPVVTRNIPALVPIGGILLLLVGGIAVIVLAVRKSKLGAGRTMAIGCGVILVSVLGSQTLQQLLNRRPVVFLGRISYSVYLLQLIVILCLLPPLVAALNNWGITQPPILFPAVMLAGAAATIGGAALMYQLVELPVINFGHWLTRKIQLKFQR